MTASHLAARKSEIQPLLTPQLDFILLDGSSSMKSKWWDMIAGIDQFRIGLQRSAVNSHLVLSVFDTYNLSFIQRDEHIKDSADFLKNPITSYWGMTPLFDAINVMGRHLQGLSPAKCSILIVTDGEENASQDTTLAQARAILDWCREQGWQVTFMGCDFNNASQAAAMGADASNSIGVQKKLLADAGALLAAKRAAYGNSDTPIRFSGDEKQQFGGYLTNGSPK